MLGGILAILPGCADDDSLYGRVSGDRMSVVNLEASFSPFALGELSRGSNVAPARGFNTISDLVILAFSASDGKLVKISPQTDYKIANVARPDNVASNGTSAESTTLSVTDISLTLPFGNYYIVAVANYGEYHSADDGVIAVDKTSLERLQENAGFKIGEFSIEDLRGLRVGWDTEDYTNNRAMLGYFAPAGDAIPHSGSKFATVSLDRPNLNLQAWMRRCASKITVDFDGSALSDNIQIYIKDVRIYDIAKDCTLGFGNPISDEESLSDFNNHPHVPADTIHTDGTFIEFGSGSYTNWPYISRQHPYILATDGKKKDLHSENSDCLYFYENMQGVREGYNRTPVPNLEDGGVAEGYNEKDGVPYGTYIEVTARHISEANGQSDETDIKYRFTLGKNITDNFNAERNYHYKLTLRFLGNANDYHWHIDYDHEEGFKVPNPWYVSYVYNHDAYLPFDFVLSDEWEVETMTAKIVNNPWYPTTSSAYAEGDDQDLIDPTYEITPTTPDGDGDYPYQTGDNKYTGNGFLSLRAPSDESVLTDVHTGTNWNGYNAANANKINQAYFDGKAAGAGYAKVNHGERVIIENAQPKVEGSEREQITVKRRQGDYSINIPIFTREKALIKQTGYTGNNPFVGYQRVAKIELTAKVRNKSNHSETKDYTAKVNVVQVRRVVNPKGVYRKSGNFEPFHVNMKFLSSERDDGEFRSIISRGPWMAEVLGDNNFITLDGKQHVTGSSHSEIDFTIRFNRMAGGGNKNAIVRIKYHNYTCTHLIFVRQGYDAQAICGGGPVYAGWNTSKNVGPTIWDTFNMVGADTPADDPRDEGSMFKLGSLEAISSIDNIYTDDNGNPIFHEQSRDGFTPHDSLTILNPDGNVSTKKIWKDISGGYSAGFPNARHDDNTPMKISRTATMRDFEQLYLTKFIEFGYGVLYADGATETQSNLGLVNGWFRDDPSPDKNKKGMRGVFAYYWNPNDANNAYNTKNVFFPIGRSGYGHRKNTKEDLNKDENGNPRNGMGILRYSSARSLPVNDYGGLYTKFQDVAPLFEFLYRRMGAIYWASTSTPENAYLGWNGKSNEEGKYAYGMDLNYFTFDVNAICDGSVDFGRDACFVRTVSSSAGE